MTNTPVKTYGCEFAYNGKKFATHVEPESIDAAKQKPKAIGRAKLIGVLVRE